MVLWKLELGRAINPYQLGFTCAMDCAYPPSSKNVDIIFVVVRDCWSDLLRVAINSLLIWWSANSLLYKALTR